LNDKPKSFHWQGAVEKTPKVLQWGIGGTNPRRGADKQLVYDAPSLKLKPPLISNHFLNDTLIVWQKYLNHFDGFRRFKLCKKKAWNEQDLKLQIEMLNLVDKLDDFHLLNTGMSDVTTMSCVTSCIAKRCVVLDCRDIHVVKCPHVLLWAASACARAFSQSWWPAPPFRLCRYPIGRKV
jgi:hypothetical protein